MRAEVPAGRGGSRDLRLELSSSPQRRRGRTAAGSEADEGAEARTGDSQGRPRGRPPGQAAAGLGDRAAGQDRGRAGRRTPRAVGRGDAGGLLGAGGGA